MRETGEHVSPLVELGNPVIENSIPHDQFGPGGPMLRVIFTESLKYPSWRTSYGIKGSAGAAPEDIIFEDMGKLMFYQILQLVRRHISLHSHPVENGLGCSQNTFGKLIEVGLLEVSKGRVIYEGDWS